jgi:hypothetical protein
VRKILFVTFLVGFLPVGGPAGISSAAGPDLLESHDLKVVLDPLSHRLKAMDRVVLRLRQARTEIVVNLNKNLTVARISRDNKSLAFHSKEISMMPGATGADEPPSPDLRLVHHIVIHLDHPAKAGDQLVLDFEYAGELNDPPREPRHLRFVTPSETSGHIGSKGVYIGPETAWYPDLPNSLASYRVVVTTPAKWEAIAQGKMVAREVTSQTTITSWDTMAPAEGLTLTAGQYLINTRDCEGIETATYLYEEDVGLAETYLTSTCTYLKAYSRLLGAYPFPRFSVVENFFASGLGMPSYTLLGAGSIRRRYIQPYALGHEMVHSWLGNYVYNDDGGNWVEGLTTYLANYYWHELQGDQAKARDERRLMLFNYAVYVQPDQDYAIARFKRKSDQRDSAIGYSKAAMVFHMLRRELGDVQFFAGLKQLVAEFGGRRAGWRDLEAVFGKAASRDLRPFFTLWIEQPGALDVSASADPDYNVFRRIARRDLPAMLNLFVTDPQRVVVLPSGDQRNTEPHRQIAERVSRQDGVEVLLPVGLEPGKLKNRSVLLLGGPMGGPAFEWAQRGLQEGIALDRASFRVGGKEYQAGGHAVLLSFRNPDDPMHVVSVFYGLSTEATAAVAPLLFFYGWNSYVVFDNGKVIARGDEEPKQ